MCQVLFCLILFYYYPFEGFWFLMRSRKGVDSDGLGGGKELGGVEEGETITRIYYTRINICFQ